MAISSSAGGSIRGRSPFNWRSWYARTLSAMTRKDCGSVAAAVRRRRARSRTRGLSMKQNITLVVTSLLSIVLLTLHITDDIVRGISKAEPANTALVVLAVVIYATLVLAER